MATMSKRFHDEGDFRAGKRIGPRHIEEFHSTGSCATSPADTVFASRTTDYALVCVSCTHDRCSRACFG